MNSTDPVTQKAAQRLLSHLESDNQRTLIGLSGIPGSGKSTLAAHVQETMNEAVGPDVFMALGMDGFHLTKAQLRRMPDPDEAFRRRGAPWTFDPAALALCLQALRDDSEPAPWPGFQHEVGDPIEAAHIVPPSARLILVEGLYLLHRSDGWEAVSQCFDERWFLDTLLELSMQRLVQRHTDAWSITPTESESQIASNDRLNAEIVIQDKVYADWVLC